MNELLEIIVTETTRYTAQKGHNFETMEDKMKAFLGINFIMSTNKLPPFEDYWSKHKCVGSEKIQNFMIRTRFQSILHSLYFSNNYNDGKLINWTKSVLLSNI